MAKDIFRLLRRENSAVDFATEINNEALIMVEDVCVEITNKVLNHLGMLLPNRSAAASLDVDLRRKQNYNTVDLLSYLQSNIPQLTLEQNGIYDQIMRSVNTGVGGIFFLDAPGWTGKTFLLRLILAAIRSKNYITLAIVSSEITATLLAGGRTVHFALKWPLNVQLTEAPARNIPAASGMGRLMQKCNLIFWGECTMSLKKRSRPLTDHRKVCGRLGQTLPVIPRCTPANEINACLKYPTLWRNLQTLNLNADIRVQLKTTDKPRYSHQLLAIRNGTPPVDPTSGRISPPLTIGNLVSSK